METIQLFCDALHTTPKLEEDASTAKIHKAEKQHLKYITELFDQLPYRVQRIAINESLKNLLIPKGKTTEQLGLAYSVMQIIIKDTKNNKSKPQWKKVLPRLNVIRRLFDKQEKAYREMVTVVEATEKPKVVPKKVSKKSASRKKPSKKSRAKRKRVVSRKRKTPAKKRKKPAKSSRRKKYDKEFQTREELNEHDPLMLYYKSLYREKTNSETSIMWLTKFGAFDGKERDELVAKFEKIKKKKK